MLYPFSLSDAIDLASVDIDGLAIIDWVGRCSHLAPIRIIALRAPTPLIMEKALGLGADDALQGSVGRKRLERIISDYEEEFQSSISLIKA